uniref:General transcription factor IIH subunit 3 n=1 Tax=Pseudonaja textilis TaxID=8673 RepID=A0A670Z004_PSETE
MVLGNSHLFMNRNNKLAVIASHIQESRFLYPGKHWAALDLFGESGESNISGSKDGKYEVLTTINETIAEEIKDLLTNTEVKGQQMETLLAGSLAKALCCILFLKKVNISQKRLCIFGYIPILSLRMLGTTWLSPSSFSAFF